MALTTAARPQLVSPRSAATLEAVRNVAGGFDADAFHVMDERDNALIADEILHGAGSDLFVYNFDIAGKTVTGVSVIGARHLASHYRGLKHRLVASMQKTAELFIFQSFPAENMPMAVSASVVPELSGEPDFYAAVVEVTDIKTGNSIQIERREARLEYRRDGSPYERPNYQTIAQSKAYRNAVLSLVPQDVVIRWKAEMLKLKKGESITSSVLDEKRGNVLRFAASRGIALDRRAIEHLTLDQIGGLGDAAREGALPAFTQAAVALGLEVGQGEPQPAAAQEQQQEPDPQPARRGRGRPRNEPAATSPPPPASPPPPPSGPSAQTADQPAPQQQRRVNFEV
jgi:hypothetical protein